MNRCTHTFKFEAIDLDERLGADVETVLYRVVQEAINNVSKHAEARKVIVRFIRWLFCLKKKVFMIVLRFTPLTLTMKHWKKYREYRDVREILTYSVHFGRRDECHVNQE